MERKYWVQGDEVWGNCHECGAPAKFADIIRMSAEDVQKYKKSSNTIITFKEPPIFFIVCVSLAYYILVWVTLRLNGFSVDTTFEIATLASAGLGVCSLVGMVIRFYRIVTEEDRIRQVLLKRYGKEMKYPEGWTRWNPISPARVLILPDGATTLPKD